MKILLVHCDSLQWEPTKKAIKSAEDIQDKSPVRVEECLVVFTCVEKADERNPEKIIEEYVKNIKDVAGQVKANNIVVYPFAHLSRDLASVDNATKILKDAENELKKEKEFKVWRAPFGWYKKFNIVNKGHPLAELSRELSADGSVKSAVKKEGEPEEIVSEAIKKEKEELVSEWYIFEPLGKMNKISIDNGKIEGFNFSKHKNLEKFVKYELAKSRAVDVEPPHIQLMKKLQLVGHEEGSDPGNLRYLPNGRLIKSLLEEWVTRKTVEYGAVEVETPIMYDFEHPALKSYLNRFPARQYSIQTPNKKVFLRFAACFGQFLMAKDANISYKNLPLAFYELTRYSFRAEQRGELAGLRRLRAFTMPDCHCLVKDFDQAKKELMKRFELAKQIQEGAGLNMKGDLEYAVRVTQDFLDEHKDFVIELAKKWDKPILMEVWNKRFFYFIFKYEWNFIDALDKAATLTTDQIDVENAQRYGIQYTDSDNTRKYPLILHLSPSGAIERVIYALLEKAGMQQKQGKNPVFPLWLSPTQVRLCPVNESFNKWAGELGEKLAKENIRVDIDDNAESVQKKIRNAEVDWVPAIVVLGEKERESGKLAVRFREEGKVKELSFEELVSWVKKQTEGKPFKPLSLPRLLSKRAIFVA